jgi:hypothetical protein
LEWLPRKTLKAPCFPFFSETYRLFPFCCLLLLLLHFFLLLLLLFFCAISYLCVLLLWHGLLLRPHFAPPPLSLSPRHKERLETLSLEAAEAAGSASNLSAKVQRLEATLRVDKGKRAVAKHAFAAHAAAAAREAALLKAALVAANLPLPDLTPLLQEASGCRSGGGGAGGDAAEEAEASAAEMVLLLRKEVVSLKKELEASIAAAAALQPAAAAAEAEVEVQAVVLLKDDPKFAKYLKMLAMHLPRPVRMYALVLVGFFVRACLCVCVGVLFFSVHLTLFPRKVWCWVVSVRASLFRACEPPTPSVCLVRLGGGDENAGRRRGRVCSRLRPDEPKPEPAAAAASQIETSDDLSRKRQEGRRDTTSSVATETEGRPQLC